MVSKNRYNISAGKALGRVWKNRTLWYYGPLKWCPVREEEAVLLGTEVFCGVVWSVMWCPIRTAVDVWKLKKGFVAWRENFNRWRDNVRAWSTWRTPERPTCPQPKTIFLVLWTWYVSFFSWKRKTHARAHTDAHPHRRKKKKKKKGKKKKTGKNVSQK